MNAMRLGSQFTGRTIVVAAAACAVMGAAACEKSEPQGASPGAASAPATTSPPAAKGPTGATSAQATATDGGAAAGASAAPSPSRLAERLRCSDLLPEASITQLAIAYKVQQGVATCPECGPVCNLMAPSKPYEGASVTYTCNEKVDKAGMDSRIAATKAALKKPKPLTGMGRGGLHGEKDNGTFYDVLAFDDDSDCIVVVDWMRGKEKDALGLAKLALGGVNGKKLEAAR